MNKAKKIILFLLIMIIVLSANFSLAKSEMAIQINKETVGKAEEFEVSIHLEDTSIAAMTLEIYFDQNKLEYVKGPENSNFSNNRLLYTWVDQKAENNTKLEINGFIFKTKEEGVTDIIVTGEFYQANGEKIEIENKTFEIDIGETQKESITLNLNEPNDNQASDDNSNLQSLRLDKEGMSPEFDSNIKEYYFIADNTINNLEVIAVPFNNDAIVTITGNKSLKKGLNTINIQVESKDKSKKSNYKIHVTKTDNIENANANLETLAILQGEFSPTFDANVTKYKLEIPNETEEIDLLAIPENTKANVEIVGNGKFKIGDNTITIIVTAPDKITKKKYEITVHRRNEEEEKKAEEEERVEAEKLSAILNETQLSNNSGENSMKEQNNTTNNNIFVYVMIGVVVIAIIVGIGFVIYKKKTDSKK